MQTLDEMPAPFHREGLRHAFGKGPLIERTDEHGFAGSVHDEICRGTVVPHHHVCNLGRRHQSIIAVHSAATQEGVVSG
jgi:hypothetical protein